MEPYLTTDDVARRYSITAETAARWLLHGLITGELINGRWHTGWDAIFSFEGRLSLPTGTARDLAKRPLLTIADLALLFLKTERTIRSWLRRGLLPGHQIMRTWYVDRGDLERLPRLTKLHGHQPARTAAKSRQVNGGTYP